VVKGRFTTAKPLRRARRQVMPMFLLRAFAV
jgi:hypothetical protein